MASPSGSGPVPPADGGASAPSPLLSARGLGKSFPGVKALDGVDLEIRTGEILALCGENGAGKSTLIKILGGVLPYGTYQGTVRMQGRECRFRGPRDALAAGISIIFQELALAAELTVAENVFLGREPGRAGFVDRERMEAEAARRLALLGQSDIRPDRPVRELSVGGRQMVEIARALPSTDASMDGSTDASMDGSTDGTKAGSPGRILILDEPTSALSLRESRVLLDVILRLKHRGLGVLYISHKLDEVLAVADRISVLRNGRSAGALDRSGADAGTLISMMVGRKLEEVFPPRSSAPAAGEAPLLRVRDWTVPSPANPRVDLVSGVSFDLRKGEILGLAGLMGAGRTELMESLFGLGGVPGRGRAEIDGKPYTPSDPGRAVARGVALVPEDRRRHGFLPSKSILENITGACLERFCRLGQFIDGDAESRQAGASMRELGIKAPDAEFIAGNLSGGNQQKVVLAKWLLTGPRILFLDDPTRGVDVGAKSEIYRLIQSLAAAGIGILLASSETEEVLHLSHRILVLRQGRLAGEFAGGEADPETILSLSAGGALP